MATRRSRTCTSRCSPSRPSSPSDSTPFAFDRFELTGRVTQRIWDDIIGLQPNGTMPFEAAADGGARTDQMPLDRAVVRVGAG